MTHNLIVSQELFDATMRELQHRSGRRRESAAVWAGRIEGDLWIAEIVRFHHHLCDDSGSWGFLELTEEGKFALYSELAQKGLRLIALIHTHPGAWVGLSSIDRRNQICSRVGFWSLVVPRYAEQPWRITHFGVHTLTDDGWQRLRRREILERLRVGE